MSFRITHISVLILLANAAIQAQPQYCPKLPSKYSWETNKDYKRDEALVLKTLQWLSVTPLNDEIPTRGSANLFVMQWICGSPRLKIEINTDMLPFYIDYPDLLFPYIHGMAQCKLMKNADCSELQAMISGFECVAFMIQSDTELKKAKALQPIVKARKKNKMDQYVASIQKNTRVE